VFRTIFDRTPTELARIFLSMSERRRYKPQRFRSNKGFDAESKDGQAYLLCCATATNDCRQNKRNEFLFTSDPFDFFDFILRHGSHSLNWFFNLPFDMTQCMKGRLVVKARTESNEAALEEYRKHEIELTKGDRTLKISFIEGKYYKISDGKHKTAYLYDVWNFTHGSLDSISRSWLGKSKADFGVSDEQVDVRHPENYPIETLIQRCSTDAMLTAELGAKLVETCHRLGLFPRRWNGHASLAKENFVQQHVDEYIKVFPLTTQSLEILDLGFACYKGAIFQAFVKGRVDDVAEADINSAYGSILVNLPDMKNGVWTKVVGNEVSPNCFYGIYCVTHEWDGYQPYKMDSGRVLYPITAKAELVVDFITKPEVEWLRKRGLKVKILYGWEFRHSNEIPETYPFRAALEPWIELKAQTDKDKDPATYEIAKAVTNSSYGITIENTHGIGAFFNSIIGAYITALIRIKLVEWAERNMIEIYELATDAVIGRIKPDAKLSHELGEFDLKTRLPKVCIILYTGLTANENGDILRNRGIPVKERENQKTKRTSKWEEHGLVVSSERPLHPKEVLLSDKWKPEDIGTFQQIEKEFAYNSLERKWHDDNITKEKLFLEKIGSAPRTFDFVRDKGEQILDEEGALKELAQKQTQVHDLKLSILQAIESPPELTFGSCFRKTPRRPPQLAVPSPASDESTSPPPAKSPEPSSLNSVTSAQPPGQHTASIAQAGQTPKADAAAMSANACGEEKTLIRQDRLSLSQRESNLQGLRNCSLNRHSRYWMPACYSLRYFSCLQTRILFQQTHRPSQPSTRLLIGLHPISIWLGAPGPPAPPRSS
jgi:hypothetical protein